MDDAEEGRFPPETKLRIKPNVGILLLIKMFLLVKLKRRGDSCFQSHFVDMQNNIKRDYSQPLQPTRGLQRGFRDRDWIAGSSGRSRAFMLRRLGATADSDSRLDAYLSRSRGVTADRSAAAFLNQLRNAVAPYPLVVSE